MRFCILIPGLIAMLCLMACEPSRPPVGDAEIRKPSHSWHHDKGKNSSISFEEFFLKHQGGEILLIDARHPWFFHQGRIPGAINLPSDETLDAALAERLPEFRDAIKAGRTLVVYCNGFGCHDARAVSRAIARTGLDVWVFSSGWKAWKKAGLPVESTSQPDEDLSPQPAS